MCIEGKEVSLPVKEFDLEQERSAKGF